MTETLRCERCGAPVVPGTTAQACPACLLQLALESLSDMPTTPEAKPPPRGVLHAGGAGPERIGPYRSSRQLGEGGMGVVYLAEQDAAGPAPRRAQGHQARAWTRARSSRGSRPSGRRWR